MNIPGYMGKVLFVDLSKRSIEVRPLEESWLKEYIGGWGINYRLAYDLIEPKTDPFSPSNAIILGVGPLVGTPYPGANKLMATTKMAMTASEEGLHSVATSTAGSLWFGAMLKNAGYDHVVVQGRSETPVYLKIDNDEIEICDARDLWGKKDIYQTADELSRRNEGFGTLTIGGAGENLVRFSMAIVDKTSHLGKSGFGAVMGSKNLKAIIARGSKGVKVADPDRFLKIVESIRNMPKNNPVAQGYQNIGLSASWELIWVKNYHQSEYWTKKQWSQFYGLDTVPDVLQGIKACMSCPVGCRAHHVVKKGPYAGTETYTTHYLYAALVGARFKIEDPGTAIKFIDVCNRAGMCALNAMSMVDWVTRLYQEGAITDRETGGIRLSRDIKTYLLLLENIVQRKGIGEAMADGWFALSKGVGKDATKDYLQQHGIVKGEESIYPPRAAKMDPMRMTMLMTNPRGGHSPQGHSATAAPLRPIHIIRRDAANAGIAESELKKIFTEDDFDHARLTRHIEDAYAVYNCLSTCSVWATFGYTNVKVLAEAYSALTGMETSPEKLKAIGEKVINLYKLLNVREGFSRKHDTPPDVILRPIQTPDGEQALTDYYRKKTYTREDLERLLDTYYDDRGWDIKWGIPRKEKLIELGLKEFVKDLP